MGDDFKQWFGNWQPDDENGLPREGGSPESEPRPNRPQVLKECRVVNVYEASSPGAPSAAANFVLLRDNSGREFRIFLLRDVAYSIFLALENKTPDRPFTHDLFRSILEKLGATVERITIDDLWQETFYAKIAITHGGTTIDVDARPSDAIAIALRFRAPIYVAESVLEAAQTDS